MDLSTPIRALKPRKPGPCKIDKPGVHPGADPATGIRRRLLGSQQADLNLVIAKDSGRWQVDLVAGANQVRDAYNNNAGSTNNRTWDSYAEVQVQIPIGDISTRQAEVRARWTRGGPGDHHHRRAPGTRRNVNDVVRDLGTRWRQ